MPGVTLFNKHVKIGILESVLVFASLTVLAGCITHDETVVRDVERTKVEFENETAARIFYEALSKNQTAAKSESTTRVCIPVVFDTKRKVVSGPNAAFNQAVGICDSNHDGKITETEAKIFAEQVGKS